MIETGIETGARVLRAWESGLGGPPGMRSSALLSEFAQVASAQLASMTVGERDRMLFAVRHALFGDHFRATAVCKSCSERVEIDFRSTDLLAEPRAPVQRTLRVQSAGDLVIEAKVPTVADLISAVNSTDAQCAANIVLRRCICSVRRLDCEIEIDTLPPEVLGAVQVELEHADPDANLELLASCPACGAVGEYVFDIAAFLWREVEAEALRLLRDVHVLAREYGWREGDVLAMSPLRRRWYLEMVGA